MSDSRGYRHPFNDCTHYLGGVGDKPRTVVELAMSQLSAELRRKPGWWRRYANEREQWHQEACDRVFSVILPSTATTEVKLKENQIDYVLDELSGYMALNDNVNACRVSCFERIWESDDLLDPTFRAELDREITSLKPAPILISPATSMSFVELELIDRYRYPLVYGQTLSTLTHEPVPVPSDDLYSVSVHHAMLPTDLQISATHSVYILSYINNVDPSNQALYRLFEKTLSRFIPLFEHTLTDLHRNNPMPQRIPGRSYYTKWEEPDPPEFSDDEEGWATYEKEMWTWMSNRPINMPDVPMEGYNGGLEDRRQVVSLVGRKAQMFFHATELRLPAQSHSLVVNDAWSAQGMKNERIVASGFYYTAVENLDSVSLDFRMAVTFPRGYNAGDNGATLRTWGLRDTDPCHQYIGGVPIREGLAVVFPNIYQSRHSPLRLLDPSKDGLLRKVSFFLVDPDISPIPSTSNVGPQQSAWVKRALYDHLADRLPSELIAHIISLVDWPMDEADALDIEARMREERRAFIEENDQHYFSIPFDVFNGPDILLYQ